MGSCSPSELSPRANPIKALLDTVGYLDMVVCAWRGWCPPAPWSPPLTAHIPLPKFHFSILLPSLLRGGRNKTCSHPSPERGQDQTLELGTAAPGPPPHVGLAWCQDMGAERVAVLGRKWRGGTGTGTLVA